MLVNCSLKLTKFGLPLWLHSQMYSFLVEPQHTRCPSQCTTILSLQSIITMLRKPKRPVETLTGEIQPVTFKQLATRTQAIRFRAKTPSHHRTINSSKEIEKNTNKTEINFPPLEPETDNMLTKFTSIQSEKKGRYAVADRNQFQRSRMRSVSKTLNLMEVVNEDQGFGSGVRHKIKDYLKKQSLKKGEKEEQYQAIYKRQINEFKTLYQSLGSILGNIKENLVNVEEAISQYLIFIEANRLSFIDDFIEGKHKKIQKVIRESRLLESLSVAYLFLEMAQNRIEDHQSYLTNFLGYCLSNVLLTTRIYMLKEKREKISIEEFQMAVKEIEVGSFGHPLHSLEDATLRMQHNNEIIVMMQKKLGRFNTKFQLCIKLFFKEAERKKTSCAQCTHYIFQYLSLHIHQSQLLGISKCLQVAPVPYCPQPTKSYTMVIEPLGVIFSDGKYRPYLFQFLEWAHKYFEIIMWTWEMPYEPEVQQIVVRIQPYLTAKLYRYHCMDIDGVWVKDLDRLGRRLQKVIIIDFDKRIFGRQLNNGIEMRWIKKGMEKDRGLLFLCQILQEMVSTESIVSDTIRIYAEQLYNISGV